MTTTPKFEMTSRHTALGLAVIASLCLSLAGGFVVHASKRADGASGSELRASTLETPARHAS